MTNHRSRPACRRSSSQRLKATESIASPPLASSETNARSGIRLATCSSSRTSTSSTRAWPREQLLVVLDVVGVRGPQPADGQDDDPHGAAILTRMADEDQGPERHINIHFAPEQMAGHYANFANVSHSDYEFTVTFARVDHEVEDDEIPGVVVTRVNLSPRFMRELIDAMEDNYSKWQTREGIKNLPEYGGPSAEDDEPLAGSRAVGLRDPDPLDGGRVGREQRDRHPAGPGRRRCAA